METSRVYRSASHSGESGNGFIVSPARNFVTMSTFNLDSPFWGPVTSTIDWCEVRKNYHLFGITVPFQLTLVPGLLM